MFKVEIHKDKFGIEIETNSISDEDRVRKLIDDITEKFNTDGNDLNTKKLSE